MHANAPRKYRHETPSHARPLIAEPIALPSRWTCKIAPNQRYRGRNYFVTAFFPYLFRPFKSLAKPKILILRRDARAGLFPLDFTHKRVQPRV